MTGPPDLAAALAAGLLFDVGWIVAGVIAVLAVAAAFYAVGRSEDRDREREARGRGEGREQR